MSSPQQLPAKKDVVLALLEESSAFVHLDPRASGVSVPQGFRAHPQLVLQVGLRMAVPIPDLYVGDDALSCTLSFNRRPFFCYVPWEAVFAVIGEDRRGMIWPEDVPAEVAGAYLQPARQRPALRALEGGASGAAAPRSEPEASPAAGPGAPEADDGGAAVAGSGAGDRGHAGSTQAGSKHAGSTQAGSTQAGSTQAGSTQAGTRAKAAGAQRAKLKALPGPKAPTRSKGAGAAAGGAGPRRQGSKLAGPRAALVPPAAAPVKGSGGNPPAAGASGEAPVPADARGRSGGKPPAKRPPYLKLVK